MKLDCRIEDEILIISIKEDVNFENTKDLKLFVKNSVEEKKIINVIVDLEFVNFIDSSGLGTLVSLLTFLKKINGNLKIVNINSNIEELFKLTRLNDFFEIYSDISDALDSF